MNENKKTCWDNKRIKNLKPLPLSNGDEHRCFRTKEFSLKSKICKKCKVYHECGKVDRCNRLEKPKNVFTLRK